MRLKLIAFVFAGLLALLTGSAAEAPAPLTSKPDKASGDSWLFDPKRLLEVSITIAPEDWDKLRLEHHDLLASLGPTRLEKPEPKPYRTYRADVSIGGQVIKSVGLHKRGFIGSASADRPSLGIKFDAFEEDQKFCGLKRMSLNNNLQDPSQLHQVLAYQVFRKAGVPASRCSLARVTLNGKYLGIYSHVEAIDNRFLKAHFGSDRGNLYEGQVSDFRPGWVKTFEKKNNKDNQDRSDLEAVMRALQNDDARLLGQLEPLVDLEAYLSFWAVESLINHWDSYSNNENNFFVYRNPDDRKLHFIPWGADGVFGDRDPFTPYKMPESVKARSLLPYRLYHIKAVRERYRERLREVLKTAWNENELLAEVDRLEKLLATQVHISKSHYQGGLSSVRQFIRTRRSVLEKELKGPAPAWNIPLRKSPYLEKTGQFTALFETTWQKRRAFNPLTNGTLILQLQWEGEKHVFTTAGVTCSPGEDHRNAGFPTITLVGLKVNGLQLKVLAFVVLPEYYKAGKKLELDGFGAGGILLDGTLLGLSFKLAGLPVGTLELKEAGTKPGEKVVGKVQGDLYRLAE